MSVKLDQLRVRRELLLQQCDQERHSLHAGLGRVGDSADRLDHGLGLVRRAATSPVLLGAGVAAIMLMGRGKARRGLAAGISLLGVVLRARSARDLLTGLISSQVVRRSR